MVSRSALFFAFHLFLAPKLCLSNHQLLLKRFLFIRGGSGAGLESDAAILVADRPSTTTMTAPASTASMEVVETGSFKQDNKENSLLIVFSDLDGTLIHYPEPLLDQERGPSEADSTILQLPPSSTGMVGVISTQTLIKCQSIRRLGVKLVLVSGMRSSTLLKRLPYLPRADAYCCEAGGRIYYPTILPSSLNASQAEEDGTYHRIVPIPYDGADPSDLQPFFLQEDSQWRSLMERSDAAGLDGFAGSGDRVAPVPLEQRKGALWAFARLLKERGLVLDTQGYATCFRVNKNQQISEESRLLFDKLLSGEIEHPTELATSVNLGCIDFYPAISGKKQWFVLKRIPFWVD